MDWYGTLRILDTQMRALYYRRLIEVARISPALARIHTGRATIEQMKIYLSGERHESHTQSDHRTA
jgi:hypothetical protein